MSALLTNERMFAGVDVAVDAPEEIVSLSKLKPHPNNYQSHPEEQLVHLRASIDDHGIYRNIVVAEDYTILAGHGVFEAAKQLGRTEIPVRRLPISPDSPDAARVIVLDNEMRLLATQDHNVLETLLREMSGDDPTDELNKLIEHIGDNFGIHLTDEWRGKTPIDPDSIGEYDPDKETSSVRINNVLVGDKDMVVDIVEAALQSAELDYKVEVF